MSQMTFAQANAVCYAAGFRRNKGIVLMPCIGWAESRLRTDARHTNDNGTIDRGWLQINSIHTDISDADCDDPLKAAQWAFAFTSGGTKNYTAWSTYNSGAYKGPEGLVYNLFDFAETVRDLNHQLDDVDAVLADTQARLDAAMQTVADEKAQIAAGLVREAALNAKIDNAIVALQA